MKVGHFLFLVGIVTFSYIYVPFQVLEHVLLKVGHSGRK